MTDSRPAPPPAGRVGARPSLWDVPPAVWGYGLLRSLAFVAPTWAEGGQIGIGVIPVLVLYVLVLRRARWAWMLLVGLDILSLGMLITVWVDSDDAPLAVPILAALALITLLLPSVRRWVGVTPRAAHGPSSPSSSAANRAS